MLHATEEERSFLRPRGDGFSGECLMLQSNRRKFLKSMAAGALATGIPQSIPAWATGMQAKATAPPALDPLPANEARLPQIKAEPWVQVDSGSVV